MRSRLRRTHEGQVGACIVCTESISPQGARSGTAPQGGVIQGVISGRGNNFYEALKNTKVPSRTVRTAAAFLGNVCPLNICVYGIARVPASLSSG